MNNCPVEIIENKTFSSCFCLWIKPHGNKAFTLAEVLTTLMVIGVVAVLTVPAMMNNINKMILSKQQTVFQKKFNEGLSRMRVDGKLEDQYSTTQDFVAVMKKYFNITQVCEKGSLQNCFAEKFVATVDTNQDDDSVSETKSKEIIVSSVTTTKSLTPYSLYNTDVVGLKFADGSNMLITYDPECSGAHPSDTQASLTQCFGYVYDVNNAKTPNHTGKDIGTNLALIDAFNLSFEILDYKIYSADEVGAIYDEKAEDVEWNGTLHCSNGMSYYKGAQEFCKAKGGRMISVDELNEIATQVYGENFNKNQQVNSGFDAATVTSSPLWQIINGTSNETVYIWAYSSLYESIGGGYMRYFAPTDTQTGGFVACAQHGMTLCVK